MRVQRPDYLPRATDGVAEHLPFADDGARPGPGAQRRSQVLDHFSLNDYAPEVIAESLRYLPISAIREGLGGAGRSAIPLDCKDGLSEARYGRPE